MAQLNFLGPVSRGLSSGCGRGAVPAAKMHKMKKIDADVAAVVKHLKVTLGATWAQAIVPRQQAHSLLVNPPRTHPQAMGANVAAATLLSGLTDTWTQR